VCFSDKEVGVDCEDTRARKDRKPDFENVARRFFTADEQEYIAYGEPGAEERFFEVWTAKEAYMKYTGNGFSEGFQSFSVFNLHDAEIKTRRLEGAPHIICSVCNRRSGEDGLFTFQQGRKGRKGDRPHG